MLLDQYAGLDCCTCKSTMPCRVGFKVPPNRRGRTYDMDFIRSVLGTASRNVYPLSKRDCSFRQP